MDVNKYVFLIIYSENLPNTLTVVDALQDLCIIYLLGTLELYFPIFHYYEGIMNNA